MATFSICTMQCLGVSIFLLPLLECWVRTGVFAHFNSVPGIIIVSGINCQLTRYHLPHLPPVSFSSYGMTSGARGIGAPQPVNVRRQTQRITYLKLPVCVYLAGLRERLCQLGRFEQRHCRGGL